MQQTERVKESCEENFAGAGHRVGEFQKERRDREKQTMDGEGSDSFQRHTVDVPGLVRVDANNLSRLDKLWNVYLHPIFQRRGLQGIVLSPTDPRSC